MGKLKKLFAKYQNMNKAAKATIWFVICSFFQRGITVLTTPIFTRLLNTGEYGIYSVFSSWLEIFTVIVTMRISYGAYMRNIIKKPEIREQYASSLQGLTCVQVAVWFVVYFLLRNQVDRYLGLDVPMMLCMFGMILFSTWFSFWAARERVDYNYRKLVGVTVAISILKPLVGIILVLSTEHHKVMARIIGLVAVEFVVYVGMFISQMKKGKVFYWRSESWNDGKDTIFFLHGLTADHSMFDGQIRGFSERISDSPGSRVRAGRFFCGTFGKCAVTFSVIIIGSPS